MKIISNQTVNGLVLLIRENVILFFVVCIIMLESCITKIEEKNKITTVGKIVSYYGKNSRRDFVYYYKSNLYKSSASFNGNIFSYGDMFLVNIDQENPDIDLVINPRVKIFDTLQIRTNKLVVYDGYEFDLRLLLEFEK